MSAAAGIPVGFAGLPSARLSHEQCNHLAALPARRSEDQSRAPVLSQRLSRHDRMYAGQRLRRYHPPQLGGCSLVAQKVEHPAYQRSLTQDLNDQYSYTFPTRPPHSSRDAVCPSSIHSETRPGAAQVRLGCQSDGRWR